MRRLVIKWFCMWPINSCDLISYSGCVVDSMMSKDRWEVKKICKTFSCEEQGSQGRFLLSQKLAVHV